MENNSADPSVFGGSVRTPLALLGLLAVLVLTSIWAFSDQGRRVRNPEGARVDPPDAYNPVSSGERLPDGFRQLLPRDAIRPVYDPHFVPAGSAGWADDVDVIGVTRDGEAKAYPVSFLNGREMVVDEIAGVPILVSW